VGGMSRVHLNIDRLVLNGLESDDRKALVEGLQAELSQVLSDPVARAGWERSHRTPVLKAGGIPLEPGPLGARKFGANVARAIGKGLKP
jgi:hypothetical protein